MKLDKKKWIEEVRRVESEIKLLKKMMHEPGYERTFPFSSLFELKAEATRLYTLRRVMKIKNLIELSENWNNEPDIAWSALEVLSRQEMVDEVLATMTEAATTHSDADWRRQAEAAINNPFNDKREKTVDLKSFWYLVQSNDKKHIWSYYKDATKLTSKQIISLILDGVPGWKEGFLKDSA